MVKKLMWLGIGLAAGALVVRKLSRMAHSYSPSGLAASARDSGAHALGTVRDFVADVREGMAEHEQILHTAIEQGVTFDEATDDFGANR